MTFSFEFVQTKKSISTASIITRLTSKELWKKDPDTGDVSKCKKK
jgi:hypothetical protein